MKSFEIEHWARSVIERILSGKPAEDARVEVKADWPPPEDHRDIARRIAGMCNAAGLEPTLLIIGVNEKDHRITGATMTDAASWWPSVVKYFESSAPTVRDHIFKLDETHTIVAIQFDTDSAPYIVTTGDGRVSHEVPWRELTRVRSARRGDLLKILVPKVREPRIEIMEGSAWLDRDLSRLHYTARLFFDPGRDSPVYVRMDRSSVTFQCDSLAREMTVASMKSLTSKPENPFPIREPLIVKISGDGQPSEGVPQTVLNLPARIILHLNCAGEIHIATEIELTSQPSGDPNVGGLWRFISRDSPA